jgi:hypothetical protein
MAFRKLTIFTADGRIFFARNKNRSTGNENIAFGKNLSGLMHQLPARRVYAQASGMANADFEKPTCLIPKP